MITSLLSILITGPTDPVLSEAWIQKEWIKARNEAKILVGQEFNLNQLWRWIENAPTTTQQDRARVLIKAGICAEYRWVCRFPKGFDYPIPAQKSPLLRRARFLISVNWLGENLRTIMPDYKEEYRKLVVLWPDDPFIPAAIFQKEDFFRVLKQDPKLGPLSPIAGLQGSLKRAITFPSNWVMFRDASVDQANMARWFSDRYPINRECVKYLIIHDQEGSKAACAYFGIQPARRDLHGGIRETKKAYPKEFAEIEAEIAREKAKGMP